MIIDESYQKRMRILSVSGEVDLYHTHLLLDQYKKCNENIKGTIVCLKDVSYMDSSGIGALIQMLRLARKESKEIYYSELSKTVESLIELSKLKSFFPITTTMEETFSLLEEKEAKVP